MARRQIDQLGSPARKKRVGADEEGVGAGLARKGRERRVDLLAGVGVEHLEFRPHGAGGRLHVSHRGFGTRRIGWIDQHGHASRSGHELTQELQPLCLHVPIIILAGDHYFTTKCFNVWNLRATAHDIDRAEAFRTSELQHKLAHRRTGSGLGQPVAGLKIVLDHSHHPGRNRIHQSLRGVLVREIARYGYDPFRWAYDEFTPRTPNVQKNDARARCGTCDARPKLLDDTDALDAGTGWQRRLTAEAAAHDVHVARMNRRKSHADEDFTWTGFRFR